MPRRIRVPISYEYSLWCNEVAQGRIDRAEEFGRQPKDGQSKEATPFDTRIGTKAEGAVAQHYGLPYDPGPDPDEWDVGHAEVRGTQWHSGRLIGHKGDPEKKMDMIYILCTGKLNELFSWMVGWCYGRELLQPERWGDPFGYGRLSFTMLQEELKDLRMLVCIDGIIQEPPEEKQMSLF